MNDAEQLLAISDEIHSARFVIADFDECGLNRCALALRFADSRPNVRLKALLEDWPLTRIVRELNV